MIITNEEILRGTCEDVSLEEVDDLIRLLESGLEYSEKMGNPGVGLAAPQIGILKKAAIIRINDIKINIFNAKIEKAYDLLPFKNEGCLSIPGKTFDTMRYREVYITNNLVYPHSFVLSGFVAIAAQHELDHLNGKLVYDNAIKVPKITKVKLGPNDKCFCGSGKKYKRCCNDKR